MEQSHVKETRDRDFQSLFLYSTCAGKIFRGPLKPEIAFIDWYSTALGLSDPMHKF